MMRRRTIAISGLLGLLTTLACAVLVPEALRFVPGTDITMPNAMTPDGRFHWDVQGTLGRRHLLVSPASPTHIVNGPIVTEPIPSWADFQPPTALPDTPLTPQAQLSTHFEIVYGWPLPLLRTDTTSAFDGTLRGVYSFSIGSSTIRWPRVPIWRNVILCTVLGTIGWGALLLGVARLRQHAHPTACPACRYDCEGVSDTCPECGKPIPRPKAAQQGDSQRHAPSQ